MLAPYKRAPSLGSSYPMIYMYMSSVADRYQLLPNNEDFVFDFNTATSLIADRKNFPALVGTGVAVSIGRTEGELSSETSQPP